MCQRDGGGQKCLVWGQNESGAGMQPPLSETLGGGGGGGYLPGRFLEDEARFSSPASAVSSLSKAPFPMLRRLPSRPLGHRVAGELLRTSLLPNPPTIFGSDAQTLNRGPRIREDSSSKPQVDPLDQGPLRSWNFKN